MYTNVISRKRFSTGFSLLELLLVLSLAPIVFFAVYANFSVGVRLWARVQKPVPAEDALIFFQKARADFESMMRFAEPPFEGTKDEAVFMSAMDAPKGLGGSRGIGQVRYYFDGDSRNVFREQKNFSQVSRDSGGTLQRWIPGVSDLKFSYLAYDTMDKKYFWLDSFSPKEPGDLPVMVKMEYILADSGQKISHTFTIPSGGGSK